MEGTIGNWQRPLKQARARLAEPIALELLVALGYEWSPGLKSAREKIRAVLEQYPQAAYLRECLASV